MIRIAPGRPVSGDHPFDRGRLASIAVAVVAALLMGIAGILLVSGSKTAAVLAFGIAAAPMLLYLAISRPFIFPFGLYAILVPFNHLIVISGLGTLTKGAAMLATAALLFTVVRTKRIVHPPTVLFAWLAFVTWACMSLAWALNPDESLSLIGTLLQLFVLFVATAVAPISSAELRILLAMLVLGGTAAAAYGGELFLGGAQTNANRLFLQSGTAGEYLDPNHFAAALLLPIAIVLVATLRGPTLLVRFASIACFGVLMIGIYASGSRGGLIAVAALALFVLWRTRKWLQLAVIVLLAAALSFTLKTAMWARFAADMGTGSGRTSIWAVGAHAFTAHPVIGAGAGNFPDAYNLSLLQLYTPVFASWDRGAHNLVLMVGVELGLVGLALLLWVLIGQSRVLRHIGPRHDLFDIRIALEAAFVGLLVISMFLDTLYWKYAWLTFTMLVLARSASLETVPHRAAVRL
jgi:putative inorganic carbon (hco3(-)) transporter